LLNGEKLAGVQVVPPEGFELRETETSRRVTSKKAPQCFVIFSLP